MTPVIRPTWRGTEKQDRAVEEVVAAVRHAERVNAEAQDAIWARVREARTAGVPDTVICRNAGITRSLLNRKLGSRKDSDETT